MVRLDYSRYTFFYLTYLIEKNRIEDAKILTDEIDYVNASLLLSQGKVGSKEIKIRNLAKYFHAVIVMILLENFIFNL